MIEWWNKMEFVDPQMFWLLLLLPLIIGYYVWQGKKQHADVRISSLKG
jgi:Ca-activated chloride channel family protein